MKTSIFEVALHREEDGRWSAWIEALPGCAAWGYNRGEALAAIKDLVTRSGPRDSPHLLQQLRNTLARELMSPLGGAHASLQLLQQCLSVLQICRIKALDAPVVDLS